MPCEGVLAGSVCQSSWKEGQDRSYQVRARGSLGSKTLESSCECESYYEVESDSSSEGRKATWWLAPTTADFVCTIKCSSVPKEARPFWQQVSACHRAMRMPLRSSMGRSRGRPPRGNSAVKSCLLGPDVKGAFFGALLRCLVVRSKAVLPTTSGQLPKCPAPGCCLSSQVSDLCLQHLRLAD